MLVVSCRIPDLGPSVIVLDGVKAPGVIVMEPDRLPLWIYTGKSPPSRSLLRTVDGVLAHRSVFGAVALRMPNLTPAEAAGISGLYRFSDREFRFETQPSVETGGFVLTGTDPSVLIDWSGKNWRSGTLRAWNYPGAWICLSRECRPPGDYIRSGLPLIVGGAGKNPVPRHALRTRSFGQIELYPTGAGVVIQPSGSRRSRRG
jgi:hypothetical protein